METMLTKIVRYLYTLRSLQRVNMSLARGGAMRAARSADAADPSTWEFAGFSQNGEDGIIDMLLSQLRSSNRYFVEIGASDGLENNTTWLALARRYAGLWIEGDPAASRKSRDLFQSLNYGLAIENMFATRDTASAIVALAREKDPDFFSIDIDGVDYHVAEAMFSAGFRPKVCAVEYNSAFGPDLSVTVPYVSEFRVGKGRGTNIFYGCSLRAWQRLFARNGYAFVTVDMNGVNAFFARPEEMAAGFLENVRSKQFAENTSQSREYGAGWQRQLALVEISRLHEIT
jgi:hypothetical protein